MRRGFSQLWQPSQRELGLLSRRGCHPRGPLATRMLEPRGPACPLTLHLQCQWPYCAAEPWERRAPPGCQPTPLSTMHWRGCPGGEGLRDRLPKPVLTQREGPEEHLGLAGLETRSAQGAVGPGHTIPAGPSGGGRPAATPAQTLKDPVVSANPKGKATSAPGGPAQLKTRGPRDLKGLGVAVGETTRPEAGAGGATLGTRVS